jgi:hypothetical protein
MEAACAGFDRGAGPSADKNLGPLDGARARQMIEMHAEFSPVAPVNVLSRVKSIGAKISCRKSEIKINLPNEQPIPSTCQSWGRRFDGAFATEKQVEKSSSENLL